MSERPPSLPPMRRAAVWGLTLYCCVAVALGLPVEVGPAFFHAVTGPVRDVLNDHGINPWHFVFPGRRGKNKRRHIAIRYTGVTAGGERVVLHEAPPGITAPAVRFFDNARTTVSMKSFTLNTLGQVMLAREDGRWQKAVDALRAFGPVRRSVVGFCTSETLNGGASVATVEMDIFTAGISYETGEQYGRATHLLEADCELGAVSSLAGEASDRPVWPGVTWLPLP